MADVFGPFATSGNTWSDGEWSRFAPTWAPSGPILAAGASVPASATTGEWAFASSGLNVSAGTGRAWVRGFGITRTGTPTTHATTANTHATWSRRDRLVLRRDLAAGTVTTAVKIGTAAASPVAPSLTQTETGVWEETLFSYLTPPNSGTSITGVIDERKWVRPDGQGYVDADLSASTLRITGTGDASPTSTGHPFQIGPDNGLNIAIDQGEIVARNNGALAAGLGFAGVRLGSVGNPVGAADAATKAYVDALKPKHMRAQRNVDTPLSTSGQYTAFGSNTNWGELDPNGLRTTGAVWIAPGNGWMRVAATIVFAANSTGARGIQLMPLDGQGIGEGAGQPYELVMVGAAPSPRTTTITGTHTYDVTTGQRVQLEGYQSSGGSLSVLSVRMSATFYPS